MFKNKILLSILGIILFVFFLTGCGSDEANSEGDNYPKDNIEVTVPYSAGGGTDILARNVAEVLEKDLETSIVVTNKTGGGGEIGMEEISRDQSDGYNLGVLNFPDNVVLSAYQDTEYNNEDFEYLASYTESPAVLVSAKDRFKDLDELVDYAKENPGEVTVGVASDAHVYTMVSLEEEADIELSPVMNESGNESYNSVLGGHVDVAVVAQQFGGQAVDEGLPILGVASDDRIDALPDAPTFEELDYEVDLALSRVFTVPSDSPEEIKDKLIESFDEASQNEDLKAKITESGENYKYRSGDELNEHLEEVSNKIEDIVKGNEEKFELGE